jgi:dimethylhistidine N-methyltransferase
MMEGEASPYLPEAWEVPARSHGLAEARADGDFAEAVLQGLSRRPRAIPCRFFYDARGSELFEEITKLPEYYPTRVETTLLEAYGREIAALAGPGRVLIEFGSGSSRKTSLLLGALSQVPAYVPIDIAAESLREAAEWLSARHRGLAILPLIADFTATQTLPPVAEDKPRLGFFSGSTIGNLTRDEARGFLANAARSLGPDSAFLVGVDLKKSEDILVPAYNDAQGVTAAFNLNLLARINRELGGTFELSRFAHDAVWNADAGRMEMYLVSLAEQIVRVWDRAFSFTSGERIHTENSHKYSVPEFQALARAGGWQPVKAWTDPNQLFSLHLLRAD